MAKHGYIANNHVNNGTPIPVTVQDNGKIVPRDDRRYVDESGNRKGKK